MTGYVDFHCHLDLYPDFEERIKDAERNGIYTLAVTTTPRAWERNHSLTRKLKYVKPALGLHPQIIDINFTSDLNLWREKFTDARYIGEIGLDASPAYIESIDYQKEVFSNILSMCAHSDYKILSVHAVRSVDLVLDLIEKLLPATSGAIVLHWFTGTNSQARRAIELGCYFSINQSMARSSKGRKLIELLPAKRILTETDGPFVYSDQTQLENLKITINILSDILNTKPHETKSQIINNLRNILSRTQEGSIASGA